VDESIVMYIKTGSVLESAVATENKEFAMKLKAWAESQGYTVRFSRGFKDDGFEHK